MNVFIRELDLHIKGIEQYIKISKDEIKSTKAKNYKSFEKYYFDHYHHRTASSDPNVAFRSPATKGMNYGFYEFDNNINNIKVNNIYKPLRKCPETKYAEELIKSKYISYK